MAAGLVFPLAGLAALSASLAVTLLAPVVLWPVYPSLIGNVESASAYPDGRVPAPRAEDDPIAVLQRRYAVGEVDRDEFERRLDDLLRVEELAREGDAPSPDGVEVENRLAETADR